MPLGKWFDKHLKQNTVEPYNSGQVGCPEIVPYCGIFPYFASSLFTNGHFGHSGFVPYFASFPYFASPYCERLLYFNTGGPRIARIFGGKKTPCYAKPCYAGTTLVLNY